MAAVSLCLVLLVAMPPARAYADHFTNLAGLGETALNVGLVAVTVVIITLAVIAFLAVSVFIRKRYIESERHQSRGQVRRGD